MGEGDVKQSKGSATLRRRLSQIRACERSGESLKAYAARQGVSVHALDQAKKLARQHGLWPAHGEKTGDSRVTPVSASRFVEAVPAMRPEPRPTLRLRLAGGDVLEVHGALEADVLAKMVSALRNSA